MCNHLQKIFICTFLIFLYLNVGVFAQKSLLELHFSDNFVPEKYYFRHNAKKIRIYFYDESKSTNGEIIEKNGKKFKLITEYMLNKNKTLFYSKNYKYNGMTTVYYYLNDTIPIGSLNIENRKNEKKDTTDMHYYEYDSNKRLIASTRFELQEKNKLMDLVTFNYINSTNCLLKRYVSDSTMSYMMKIFYDKDGFEIKSESIPKDNLDKSNIVNTIQSYKLINGRHFLTNKLIDGGHYQDIYGYEYNDAGQIVKEVEEHAAKAVCTYVYYKDYHERFEDYSASSNIGYIKYDKWGNIEFDGHLNAKTKAIMYDYYKKFKYEYDKYGNWTAQYEYTKPDPKIKESLTNITLREIDYFEENDISEVQTKFPIYLVTLAINTHKTIPTIAMEKHKQEYAYNLAVENGQYGKSITTKSAKNINDFLPKLWIIKENISGDIMGDSTNEEVVVYEKPVPQNSTHEETRYCIAIFQKKNGLWELYEQYFKAINDIEHINISIKDKILIIENQRGGYGEDFTKYRFRFQQGDLCLIGVTMSRSSCEENETFDYNLNTGKVNYERSHEDCSEEQTLKLPKNIKITIYQKSKQSLLLKMFRPLNQKLEVNKDVTVTY